VGATGDFVLAFPLLVGLAVIDGAGEWVGYLVFLTFVGAGDEVGVGSSTQGFSALLDPLPLPWKMLLGILGPCRLRRRSYALIGLPFTEPWAIAGNIATVKRKTQGRRRRYIIRVVDIFSYHLVSLSSSAIMISVRVLVQRWRSQSLFVFLLVVEPCFHGNGAPSLCVDCYLNMNEALEASILLSIQIDRF
jgi:hypothetical protein